MKVLRGLLVIVLAGLIVWGLRTLGNNQDYSESKIFSPLWNRLVSTTTDPQQNIMGNDSESTDTSGSNAEEGIVQRISQELLPQLRFGGVSSSIYNTIVTNGKILGNENANYLMLEYCDYSIQYCRQAQREGALIAYQDALNTDLGYIYKPFVLSASPSSQTQHHALQCAQKTGNESQINRLHALLFDEKNSNEIRKLGKELNIPGFESCFLNENSSDAFSLSRSVALDTFDITQLPSYVLIDTRTLERTVIPGLYEEELVTEYLKNLR